MESKARLVSTLERVLFLKRISELRDFPSTELAHLAQYARERSFRKGDRVSRLEERMGSVHAVIEGRFHIRGGEYGEEFIGPSQALGFLSVLGQSDEGLEATAKVDTLTLEIDRESLADVFEDHFHILHSQIRSLAELILRERMKIPEGTYLAPGLGKMPDAGSGMDLVQRLLYMHNVDFVKPGNIDAWVEMASHMSELHFAPETVLWEREDPSGFMYLIVEGEVHGVLGNGKGYFRAGPGYPLGNTESQCGKPRWYQALTRTQVMVLRGETDFFIDLLEDHFQRAMDFLASMARNIVSIRKQSARQE